MHFKNSYYKYSQEFKENINIRRETQCLKVKHTKSEMRNSQNVCMHGWLGDWAQECSSVWDTCLGAEGPRFKPQQLG